MAAQAAEAPAAVPRRRPRRGAGGGRGRAVRGGRRDDRARAVRRGRRLRTRHRPRRPHRAGAALGRQSRRRRRRAPRARRHRRLSGAARPRPVAGDAAGHLGGPRGTPARARWQLPRDAPQRAPAGARRRRDGRRRAARDRAARGHRRAPDRALRGCRRTASGAERLRGQEILVRRDAAAGAGRGRVVGARARGLCRCSPATSAWSGWCAGWSSCRRARRSRSSRAAAASRARADGQQTRCRAVDVAARGASRSTPSSSTSPDPPDSAERRVNIDVFTLFPEWFDWFTGQRHVGNALAGGSRLRCVNFRDHTPLSGAPGRRHALRRRRGDAAARRRRRSALRARYGDRPCRPARPAARRSRSLRAGGCSTRRWSTSSRPSPR